MSLRSVQDASDKMAKTPTILNRAPSKSQSEEGVAHQKTKWGY